LQQTPQPDLFGVQPQPTPAPVKSFKPQPEKQQENQLPSANLFDDFENLINDELLDPEILSIIQEDPALLAAIQEDPSLLNEAIFNDNNQIVEPAPQPKIAAAPQFSVTTIFKSGRNPGEFTRLISTIYYDERRKRDTLGKKEPQYNSRIIQTIDDLGSDSESGAVVSDVIQSGLNF